MVASQQFPQVSAAARMTILGIRDGPASGERLGNLVIQFHPVSHDHESPVARDLPQHLLGKEHHREALAAALGLPKHPRPPMPERARLQHGRNGVVDAEVLMILPEDFDQPRFVLREQGEVLHQVYQAAFLADATNHHVQRHPPGFVLVLDAFPFKEPFPVGRE